MREVQITVYKFDELHVDVQNAIKEKWIDGERECWSGQFTIDYYKEVLESIGFRNVDINFSGFWSQGDGASFFGECRPKDIDLDKIKQNYTESVVEFASKILEWYANHKEVCQIYIKKNCHRYSHSNTMYIASMNDDEGDCLFYLYKDDYKELLEIFRDYANHIYKDLESDYDSISENDEMFNESYDVKEQEYFVNGRRYN